MSHASIWTMIRKCFASNGFIGDFRHLQAGNNGLGEPVQVVHVVMQALVVPRGHAHRFIVENAPVDGRYIRGAVQLGLGTPGKGARQKVGRLVHVDPGAVKRHFFVKVSQHLRPVIQSVGVRKVGPNCRMRVPDLKHQVLLKNTRI